MEKSFYTLVISVHAPIWRNILNCGDHHSIVFGCSGYDGCGSGQHWCRYLWESGVVEIVVTTESSSTEMSSTEVSSTEMSSTEFSSTEMSTTRTFFLV